MGPSLIIFGVYFCQGVMTKIFFYIFSSAMFLNLHKGTSEYVKKRHKSLLKIDLPIIDSDEIVRQFY